MLSSPIIATLSVQVLFGLGQAAIDLCFEVTKINGLRKGKQV
jgi:hypothetical protein